MTFHSWGDGWPHWNELQRAVSFIENYWSKWGRIGTALCKEKFGTFRDHSTFYRGPLAHLVHGWQAYIYNRGIQLACLRYPNVIEEICSDLQHYDLIKDGPGTRAGGQELHDRYWYSPWRK